MVFCGEVAQQTPLDTRREGQDTGTGRLIACAQRELNIQFYRTRVAAVAL